MYGEEGEGKGDVSSRWPALCCFLKNTHGLLVTLPVHCLPVDTANTSLACSGGMISKLHASAATACSSILLDGAFYLFSSGQRLLRFVSHVSSWAKNVKRKTHLRAAAATKACRVAVWCWRQRRHVLPSLFVRDEESGWQRQKNGSSRSGVVGSGMPWSAAIALPAITLLPYPGRVSVDL